MKRKKGLSLVEIIVSLALLGILSIAFMNAFTMGFVKIVDSGNRTSAVSKAQEFFYSNPVIVSSADITVTLPLPSGTSTIVVNGSYAKGEVILNAGTPQELIVEVKTFVPGMSQD